MQIRIYYDDTDASGVMYHTNYIKYCERARSEIFFLHNAVMDDENGYFLVKSLEANFIKSAILGDILEVTTKLISNKKASVVLSQEIYKDSIKLFELKVTIVYMQYGKISAIPKEKLAIWS